MNIFEYINQVASELNESIDEGRQEDKVFDFSKPSYQDIVELNKFGKQLDISFDEYQKLDDEFKVTFNELLKKEMNSLDSKMDDAELERRMKNFEKSYGKIDFTKDDALDKNINTDYKDDKVFVHIAEIVRHAPETEGGEGKYDIDSQGTRDFPTMDEAKKWLYDRWHEVETKFGIPLDQIKGLEFESLPTVIREKDPNAVGFIFSDTQGINKKFEKRGRGVEQGKQDFSYDKLTDERFFEYIIYTAENPIPGKNQISDDDLAKMAQG